MITNDQSQTERLIYAEALACSPEFSRTTPACCKASDIYSGFDLPDIFSAVSEFMPSASPIAKASAFDPHAARKDFPILSTRVNGRPLVWFDNAATTQKPRCVIDRLTCFYEQENSNVHRAAHTLARRTTDAYEGARRRIADFIGAGSADEIVFVRGATEGINLVASAYGLDRLVEGDEILITELEHHANIVPWQLLCRRTGAVIKTAPTDSTGQLDLAAFKCLLTARTKIVALSQISNVLGTITPAAEVISLAHAVGARVLLDGAQGAAHLPTDVRALDCDFYVFSGHKLYGPTGIGVLYAKSELLEVMQPYQGGGNMITDVTIAESRYKNPPHKFEAGTGSIADAVALGAAVEYISHIGLAAIAAHERILLDYATVSVHGIQGIQIYGGAPSKAGILSFTIRGIDSDSIAEHLDRDGIAVRSGHHCSQPVLKRFGLEKVTRASFALYNTTDEIDCFTDALRRLPLQFGRYS